MMTARSRCLTDPGDFESVRNAMQAAGHAPEEMLPS